MTPCPGIVFSPKDNVAVANGRIEVGEVLPGGAAAAVGNRSQGTRWRSRPIAQGEAVVKYAQAIGRATEDIAPGDACPFAQSGVRIRPHAGGAAFRAGGSHGGRQSPHLHGLSPR